MEFASTVDFAQAARALSRAARRAGLDAPSFRCPPRLVGADRTIRRRASGAVVSVRVKGRPKAAVLADMIEGVVAANRLVSPSADRVRSELWELVSESIQVLASGVGAAPAPLAGAA
jgi:uncharacterized protein YbjT (DUF2867 family)